MAYQIIYWIYDHTDDDDFRDEKTLRDKITSSELDPDGKIKGWLDNDDWLHRSFSGDKTYSSKSSFQTKIDDWNANSLRTRISKASSYKELIEMKGDNGFDNIEDTGIKSDLNEYINTRMDEVNEGVIDELRTSVDSAVTLDELESTRTIASVRNEYGSSVAREYAAIKEMKSREFGYLEERWSGSILSKVEGATSQSDLDRLESELNNAPTEDAYTRAKRAIENARGQIEQ